jgi:hypothetical protein
MRFHLPLLPLIVPRRGFGAHDPAKTCPGLDPGWLPVFG